MASWSRFHLEGERRLEGKLMEVDSEDRAYDQLSLSSSQAKHFWMEMNEPKCYLGSLIKKFYDTYCANDAD